MEHAIKLGISSCLLGQRVRHDGGHKLDRFLVETLGKYVEYVPVCPEVEIGLGTPRETVRLVGEAGHPRLITRETKIDLADRMKKWASKRLAELESEGLCGFIFKANSPSSGMERVRVYNEKGVPSKNGVGIWARAFMAHFPLLPVEEDGRLHDPALRENFIERIFAYGRWREVTSLKTQASLAEFHARHKLLILSHSPKHATLLGKLVGQARTVSLPKLFDRYQELLMDALQLQATPAKHANVLQHILGYFKGQLTSDEKQEMLEVIRAYQQSHVPLIVPITLAHHYVRKYDQPYLRDQYYLNPHPLELGLRNHA